MILWIYDLSCGAVTLDAEGSILANYVAIHRRVINVLDWYNRLSEEWIICCCALLVQIHIGKNITNAPSFSNCVIMLMFWRYIITFNAIKTLFTNNYQNQQHYTFKWLKVSELALIRSSSIWDDGNSIRY